MTNAKNTIKELLLKEFNNGQLQLGELIRQLRKKHLRLTQRQMGNHCSMAVGTLAALEQEHDRISLKNLDALLGTMDLELLVDGKQPGAGAKKIRKKVAKLTQVELAEIADVAPGTLLAFEKGEMNISLANANKILERLETEFSIGHKVSTEGETSGSGDPSASDQAKHEVKSKSPGALALDSRAPTLAQMLTRVQHHQSAAH
jgi:transcriptional regulator with XRE-family HTH domain